ncbi:MAG: glycosyltransferase [Cyanothece sp. SIO2G6]|nr:glycosyltransferase [Cyanothece sp. SIO2G6]
MKVLHVIPSLSPKLGGPTHVVLNLVKALVKRGVEAEVATTNDDGADLLDVPLYQRTEYQDIPVWFLPRFSPPLKEFIFSSAITTWMWKNVRNYDVLDNHYLFSYAPTLAGFVARRQRIPYTVRTMGQLTPWALAQSRIKKQIYSTLIEHNTLTKAAAIHCTAKDESVDVRRFGIETPTATIPLGVDSPIAQPDAKPRLCSKYKISESRFVVLFLSRLHYKKRPDLLLQSVHQLVQNGKDLHLLMAGTGDENYISELQSLTKKLQLGNRVTFTGFVQGTDKDLLLQGSDVFVLPSFSENFGIAVAEALAAGLPVITTPGVQISPEITAAHAGLVVDGDKEQVSQAIQSLIDNPKLRQDLSRSGKQLAQQRYSWDAIAKQLAEVYKLIIQHRRLPHDVLF